MLSEAFGMRQQIKHRISCLLYTSHGGAVSKDGKEAIVLSAKPVTTDQ